jgi:hypothetical protein
MKISAKDFFKIMSIVFFVILLPWPIYILMFYMIFPEILKIVAILSLFAIEFAIGTYLVTTYFNNMKKKKKIGSKIIFGIITLSFTIYSFTAIMYLIKVIIVSLNS